jgi:hypothetical protein
VGKKGIQSCPARGANPISKSRDFKNAIWCLQSLNEIHETKKRCKKEVETP